MKIVARGSCLLVAAVAVCSCSRAPESVPLPEQQVRIDDPQRWERMVRMTDVDAREHFIADIFDPLAATWRWTGKRPTIRLKVPPGLPRIYRIEFSIPEQSFRVTGPVVLTFLVNGHVLGRKQCSAAGAYVFEKAVPPEWMTGAEVTLGAEIDKTQPVPNAPPYGFLMVAIGLRKS